jgi:hypothetical protein
MKVFIGSTTEKKSEMEEIALWIEDAGYEPVPWNKPGLFPAGKFTFQTLNALKDQVQAAVFIFGGEDETWYRGDLTNTPRDNVLIEYGLFVGSLEPSRVAICKTPNTRIGTDLLGLTYISLSDESKIRSQRELQLWLNGVATSSPTLGSSRLIAFDTKFSMPNANEFWKELSHSAKERFYLLGSSNKSWILKDPDRTSMLGDAIFNLAKNGGNAAVLCRNTKASYRSHFQFVVENVLSKIPEEPEISRANLIEKLQNNVSLSLCSSLRYQSVVSDSRVVIMPLLNSQEFKSESPVFELNRHDHGEHYQNYLDDIKRTIQKYDNPSFREDIECELSKYQ